MRDKSCYEFKQAIALNRKFMSALTLIIVLSLIATEGLHAQMGNVYKRIDGIDQLFYKITADKNETWNMRVGGRAYHKVLTNDDFE